MTKVACLAAIGLALAGCVAAPTGQPYAPPGQAYAPGTYAPGTYAPGPASVAMGGTCYAGAYVCPMAVAQPVGSTCSCPGLGAPSFGTVR